VLLGYQAAGDRPIRHQAQKIFFAAARRNRDPPAVQW
jgi:hypothetical protein